MMDKSIWFSTVYLMEKEITDVKINNFWM